MHLLNWLMKNSEALGLVFNMIGVIILFRYGIPAKELSHNFMLESFDRKKANFAKAMSKSGLGFLGIGFLIQFLNAVTK